MVVSLASAHIGRQRRKEPMMHPRSHGLRMSTVANCVEDMVAICGARSDEVAGTLARRRIDRFLDEQSADGGDLESALIRAAAETSQGEESTLGRRIATACDYLRQRRQDGR